MTELIAKKRYYDRTARKEYEPGAHFSVDEKTAAKLVKANKAALYVPPPKHAAVARPVPVTPVVETAAVTPAADQAADAPDETAPAPRRQYRRRDMVAEQD